MTVEEWIRVGQLFVAALGIVAVLVTIWQKMRSDNRAEWWRRYTWATDQTFDGREHVHLIGWVNLDLLGNSRLKTRTEEAVVDALALRTGRWDNG